MNELKNYLKTWFIPLLLLVIIVAGCDDRVGLITPPVITTPSITSTSPANTAVSVPFNQKVTATFSEIMDSTTVTTATFTLMQGTSFVAGTVSYTGVTATFSPATNLSANTAYTGTITTMAKSIEGKGLVNNYVWSFTTGAAAFITPPSVILTDPLNVATSVPINQKIAATFSFTMDATTITASTFTVTRGTSPVPGFVSYSGTTALFTAASYLLSNTEYTATITTGAKDLTGNALASNYVWTFTTGAAVVVTSPVVTSTDPVNLASNVALNQKIAATFSKTLDASTMTTATFTLKNTATSAAVPGFVSYSGSTALFTPTSFLLANTVYTATITTGAKDLAGNPLANDYVWNFTTGAAAVITPPVVSSTDPVNLATSVALNQKIAVTFSKALDATTMTTATFTLKNTSTSAAISGFVSYSGITAIFAPTANLDASTSYTATITTGAKDLAGNALAANYVWSFTTGAAVVVTPPAVSLTDPLNAAVNVPLNQKIAATFSKTMDASTINTSTFTLTNTVTSVSVSGFVSYSGVTGIFTPAANLAASTVYTATITTASKDLAGNALVANYSWSFTTGAAVVVTPPTVSSTDPVNLATGVALNQKIAATFSKTMDAATISTATFTLKNTATSVSVSGFVSYSGTTAIFAPASNLDPTTSYTATITNGAKDLASNALAANYVWSFTTGAAAVVTPPTVSSTDPLNLATSVPLNQKIAATFSTTMDASTMTTATFTLKQGTTSIAGFVSYSGSTATFAPATNLTATTVYSVVITTGAKDLAGNALVANYAWTFTTSSAIVITPPTVSSTDPIDLASAVPLNQKISATFSKTMDASTITASTFTIRNATTLASVSGFVSYLGTTAIFAPASNLAALTQYTATITTGSQDLAGNALVSNYVWNFTTGAAAVITPPTVTLTDPLNLATGVPLNQKIAATFSKTMDASTMTTANITLKNTATSVSVSGFVSYSGTIAIFAPASNLDPTTSYTATITTGAKDLAGNALAANYVWSFTTGAAAIVTPPVVSLSDPLDLATGVALNKQITATFSKTMDASTITTATFTLMQGSTFVAGTVSYAGSKATYIPSSNLVSNTTYTATITTGAKDLAGNALAANYVWSFKTSNSFIVALSANPLLGGSVSGAGSFNSGTSVTVVANPNAGYTFVDWTENGVTASTNTSYQFTITGNRTLVANFSSVNFSIVLSSSPVAGGIASGNGSFNSGSSVTVTATANTGYKFVNWTESGLGVSTSANYQFTIISNRTLVANFIVGPGGLPIDLGSAANFAILAGAGVTNTGVTTHIYGDVGSFPTATIAGLLAGNVTGTLYTVADPLVGTAKTDLTTAYNDAQGRSLSAISLPGQLGGLTLAPGLYVNSSTTGISGSGALGILTLDAGGDPNAVWVFKMGSTLITTAGTSIVLAGGAKWENIYWSVGTSATLGTTSIFYGNILADQSITLTTGAVLHGRALTRVAAVTLDANTVDKR